jgi:predicted Zn-dependent protease
MHAKLEPPELHRFSAAVGWLELGNPAEALAELALISPEQRHHPDVLELRYQALTERQDWPEALQVAGELLQRCPERATGWLHQAYAARRAPGGGLAQAWEILRQAADQFPKDHLIRYNLACYACQMQRLDEARHWLKLAFGTGDKQHYQTLALQDEDLQPLWPEIKEM